MLNALDLQLAARRMVPLNAWWLLNYPAMKLLSLTDVTTRVAVGAA